MSNTERLSKETPLELVEHALEDLGAIHRWQQAGTLTEAEYTLLMGDTRDRLKLLRDHLSPEGEEAIELTDAGAAVLAALKVGQDPQTRELIRRMPGLMTARNLAEHGAAAGRGRRYGDFVALDGDRP